MDSIISNKPKTNSPSKKSQNNKANPSYIICIKCFHIPLINISQKKLEIICTCSTYTISIEEYLLKLKQFLEKEIFCKNHPQKEATTLCYKCNDWLCQTCSETHEEKKHFLFSFKSGVTSRCPIHEKKEFELYCYDCKKHLCSDCLKKHQNHKNIELTYLSSLCDFGNFEKNVKKSENYLYKNCISLEQNIIIPLKEKLDKINEMVKEYRIRNENIIQLLKIITKSFTQYNYQGLANVYYNKEIQLVPYTNSASENLESFLNSSGVLNDDLNTENRKSHIVSKIEKKDYFQDKIVQSHTFYGHSGSVNSMCILGDGRLASCSSDKKIKIYNLKSNQCEITISSINEGSIKSLGKVYYLTPFQNDKLISASDNKIIVVWKILNNNYKCLRVLEGHEDLIPKVIQLNNGKICSCSFDGKIKIWENQDPYKCINTLDLKEKITSVFCPKGIDSFLSFSKNITFWNTKSYVIDFCIKDVECNSNNSVCQINEKIILIGSGDSLVSVDIIQHKVLRKVGTNSSPTSFMIMDASTVIYGDKSGLIYRLNPTSFTSKLLKAEPHYGSVTCLLPLKFSHFVSSSKDRLIVIWKYTE